MFALYLYSLSLFEKIFVEISQIRIDLFDGRAQAKVSSIFYGDISLGVRRISAVTPIKFRDRRPIQQTGALPFKRQSRGYGAP